MEESKNENNALVKEIITEQNAREHLANERTLLAWIRTSIGIMALLPGSYLACAACLVGKLFC